MAPRHDVAGSPSWNGFVRLVRDRPVTVALVDLGSFPSGDRCEEGLRRLRASFPGLALVAVARRPGDPTTLFRLGRAGIPQLVLLSVDRLETDLPRSVERARENCTTAVVLRALGTHVARRDLEVVRLALDEIHHQWSAEELAGRVGLSRPFLSEELKRSSLPSVGKLMLWSRLLHAGRWLCEPGRTGESVSRQLEYANGSVFRRAVRTHLNATPTQVVESGGLAFVLERFLEDCGFPEPGSGARVSVA